MASVISAKSPLLHDPVAGQDGQLPALHLPVQFVLAQGTEKISFAFQRTA